MTPIIAIFPEAPGHDSTKLLGRDNVLELPSDKAWRVPSPEQVGFAIPVVLATCFDIGLSLGLRSAPGIYDGDTLTVTVIRVAASAAEISGVAAVIISLSGSVI